MMIKPAGFILLLCLTGFTGSSLLFLEVSKDADNLFVSLVVGLSFLMPVLVVIVFLAFDDRTTLSELRESREKVIEFGQLIAFHGSAKQVLSHLASALIEKFDEQNYLNNLNVLTDVQQNGKLALERVIARQKQEFSTYIEIAAQWGLNVPEKWQYKDWVIPETSTAVAA